MQGIELFQKLYIGLEYVVPKDIGKSSKINKVVREFCKFSQRVKVDPLWVKIVNIQGLMEKLSGPQNVFLKCLIGPFSCDVWDSQNSQPGQSFLIFK